MIFISSFFGGAGGSPKNGPNFFTERSPSLRVGQKIKQGEIVGTLGQSGRATGPHLDMRLNWYEVKLDPITILEK